MPICSTDVARRVKLDSEVVRQTSPRWPVRHSNSGSLCQATVSGLCHPGCGGSVASRLSIPGEVKSRADRHEGAVGELAIPAVRRGSGGDLSTVDSLRAKRAPLNLVVREMRRFQSSLAFGRSGGSVRLGRTEARLRRRCQLIAGFERHGRPARVRSLLDRRNVGDDKSGALRTHHRTYFERRAPERVEIDDADRLLSPEAMEECEADLEEGWLRRREPAVDHRRIVRGEAADLLRGDAIGGPPRSGR